MRAAAIPAGASCVHLCPSSFSDVVRKVRQA